MNQPENNQIIIRSITIDDMTLLHRWLNSPHVNKWWFIGNKNRNPTLEEVSLYWTSRIDHETTMHCYIIYVDDVPVAYVQWYRVEPQTIIRDPENVAGIDIFQFKAIPVESLLEAEKRRGRRDRINLLEQYLTR